MKEVDAVVELRKVRKSYGAVTALESFDILIQKGEFLTLLGPSGSGKSTILNIVAGMVQPTHGRVFIDQRDVTELPARKRGLGMVFQNYALIPHMSVFDNVAFPLRVRRVPEPEIKRRVSNALEIVHLQFALDRKPSELSGGQQQRVAIARCFVYEPKLILMDEPLGALDRKLREQLQLEIKRLHTELGITILYVTHDQEEALALSDRICLMDHAMAKQIGSPQQLYFEPANRFVADFLGESNIMSGSVVGSDADGSVVLSIDPGLRAKVRRNSAVTPPVSGQQVELLVRPESIRILGNDDEAENVLEGTLRQIYFVGSATQYFVQLENGSTMVAKELSNRRTYRSNGDTVRLGWQTENSVILPAEKYAEMNNNDDQN